MAEWDSVVVGGRADSVAKDGDAEHTFDLGKFGRGSGGNFEDQSRRVHNFCYNCRTVARIAPIKGIASSKDQVREQNLSVGDFQQTRRWGENERFDIWLIERLYLSSLNMKWESLRI